MARSCGEALKMIKSLGPSSQWMRKKINETRSQRHVATGMAFLVHIGTDCELSAHVHCRSCAQSWGKQNASSDILMSDMSTLHENDLSEKNIYRQRSINIVCHSCIPCPAMDATQHCLFSKACSNIPIMHQHDPFVTNAAPIFATRRL